MGIDLGTTNSAVAYVDSADADWRVRDFAIRQWVSAREHEARATLPSAHYEPMPGELGALPWEVVPSSYAVGTLAMDRAASVPGRVVTSAKSWLSHAGVDRTAALLPWHAAPDVQRLSPVAVSGRYLQHIRHAWDAAFADAPLASQDVFLTVPASFDEVARELTLQAARDAGLGRVYLLEEPQAAFYAWIDAHRGAWQDHVRPGQTILICDIGGGTSDFTLIRVRPADDGSVFFHRVAVGEHLILGGDNLDLALAHELERRAAGTGKLDASQWEILLRTARQAKETLLGQGAPEKLTVSVAGRGTRLIGGALQIEITRDETLRLLIEGFLPITSLDDRPAARRSGFVEFGLPYAPDSAITRYLAAFLSAHAAETSPGISVVRPDLILFNGGFFESRALRDRLLEVMSSWFNSAGQSPKWTPAILDNDRLDLAVARGAAYYGSVRRGQGVRIRGGLAHSYYLGVEAATGNAAVCLVPAGTNEGVTIDLDDLAFDVLIRQPVEFPFYYSSSRTNDSPGAQVAIDPLQLSALPPMRTVLQSSGRGDDRVGVTVHARLTEVGTLDIWLAERDSRRQWRLQFDIRSASRSDIDRHDASGEAAGIVEQSTLDQCRQIVRVALGHGGRPESLVKQLEQASGTSRAQWPATFMRGLWETLMDAQGQRSTSIEHEARWLSLAGYCLRPGYGLAVDDWRVAQMWRLFPAELTFHKNETVRAEWWVLWRRLAGGLSFGQQLTLADPLLAAWRTFLRKSGTRIRWHARTFQFGPHESAEAWRALGSFELLKPTVKQELGDTALDLVSRQKVLAVQDALMFALGRFGARVPVYGPLNSVLSADTAQAWLDRLMTKLDLQHSGAVHFAVMQLARRTGDRFRDIDDPTRAHVRDWLSRNGAPAHLVKLVEEAEDLAETEQRAVFGETLPRGLRIL